MTSFNTLSRYETVSVLSFLNFNDLLSFSRVNTRFRQLVKRINWEIIVEIKSHDQLLFVTREFNFKKFDLRNYPMNDTKLKFFTEAEYLNLSDNVSISYPGLRVLKCTRMILPNGIEVSSDLNYEIETSTETIKFKNMIIRDRIETHGCKRAIFSECLLLGDSGNDFTFDQMIFDSCYSCFDFLCESTAEITFQHTFINEKFITKMNYSKKIRIRESQLSFLTLVKLIELRFLFSRNIIVNFDEYTVSIVYAEGTFNTLN
jgi:hypothetical protein